jgi:Xaa-Pro aminopeptidase
MGTPQVSAEAYRHRHAAVLAALEASDLDGLIVVADWRQKGGLRYFAGRVVWSRWSYILFQPGHDPVLFMIAPSQQYWAEKEGHIRDVRFSHHLEPALADLLAERFPGAATVGIAGLRDTMRVDAYQHLREALPAINFVEATDVTDQIRVRKTEVEIAALRETMEIAEAAFERFDSLFAPGVTHWEIVGEIERVLRGAGSYDTMILLSAGPYLREPSTESFREGDFVMFSIELAGPQGYWVEKGGMFSLGEPAPTARRLYQVCIDAVQAAATLFKPGTQAQEVAAAVEQVFERSGFAAGIWGGHGIGMDVLEPPILLPGVQDRLEEGMAIGFHPHVVDQTTGLGAYVSDVYLVTAAGGAPLARLPHELRVKRGE